MQNKDEQQVKVTADGSTTIYSPYFNQHYHSIFGARQESDLVFIHLGLKHTMQSFEEINLLEMGFGTGLNALLTAEIAALNYHKVNYTGLEAFPVSSEMVKQLDNSQQELHKLEWNKNHKLNDFFTFRKIETRVQAFTSDTLFNLVYYDAFAPESQPELWTEDLFTQIASLMAEGGVLTTYCSKGYVQRNLKAAGFCVEKHPGPARKREVLRAIRS